MGPNRPKAEASLTHSLFSSILYLFIYIFLSASVILYNKWILSSSSFNFPFPIALTLLHMGFSGIVSFFLVRVFKVIQPVKMTPFIYFTCVLPIGVCFAISLWLGNTAYLFISVSFIQMLKSLMPAFTFLLSVLFRTEKFRLDIFAIMLVIGSGIAIASFGEIRFHVFGTVCQLVGMLAEALRLVLTQVLLQRKGLKFNPITGLYYVAPCSFLCLLLPYWIIERPKMMASSTLNLDPYIFSTNAICAFMLNVSIFVIISKTSAVTVRVAGIVKDWILIAISAIIFVDSKVSILTLGGYFIALGGVVFYNRIKLSQASNDNAILPTTLENIKKGTT